MSAITERADEGKQARTLADAIVDTVHEPLVVLDQDLRVVAAGRSFYQTFGVVSGDTQGRLFYELADGQWRITALRTLYSTARVGPSFTTSVDSLAGRLVQTQV